jgi:hypothetical protein
MIAASRPSTLAALVAATLIAGLGVVGGAGVTGAGASSVAANTTTSAPSNLIGPKIVALSGSVSGPAITTPWKLSGTQAAAFFRSFLAFSIFGHPVQEAPPSNVPVYTIGAKEQWGANTYAISAYYAEDTTTNTAWVGMPPQALGWAGVPKLSWIRAQEPTRASFHSITPGLTIAAPGKQATPASQSSTTVAAGSSGDSGSAVPYVLAVGAIALIACAGVFLRRRTTRQASTKTTLNTSAKTSAKTAASTARSRR